MGPRREAEFKRKEGTVTDVVRAAPSLSSTSTSGAAGEAAVASIPLSPLDDALFIRPLVIGWSAFFKGQLEARLCGRVGDSASSRRADTMMSSQSTHYVL